MIVNDDELEHPTPASASMHVTKGDPGKKHQHDRQRKNTNQPDVAAEPPKATIKTRRSN